MTYHRFVLHHRVPDYLLIGWMALPSLDGTHHGHWSAHCIWLCDCKMTEPAKAGHETCFECGQPINQITQDSTLELFTGKRFHADCRRLSHMDAIRGDIS